MTVIVLAWGLTFPIGGIVQNRGDPFGLLPCRWSSSGSPRSGPSGRAGLARVSGWLAVVGLSAIWAWRRCFTTATLTGLVLAEAMTRPPGSRRRWILGESSAP